MTERAILIAGPTASGKSALAVALAERLGGVVVNADSKQVYAELPILTAQPTVEERARAPHRLYGHVTARTAYSTGRYVADMAPVLAEAQASGRTPILVGGTGLYFRALLEGLSPIPDIPAPIRAHWREQAARLGARALHATLQARDAEMAERLAPSDTQRITRALEVVDATGRSLAVWQQEAGTPLLDPAACVKVVVDRPRSELVARTDARFLAMLDHGALAEVRHLMTLNLDSALPALRAVGVAPLSAHLAGDLTLNAAIARAQVDTRQYIKRQQTWLRKFMADWHTVSGDASADSVLTLMRQ